MYICLVVGHAIAMLQKDEVQQSFDAYRVDAERLIESYRVNDITNRFAQHIPVRDVRTERLVAECDIPSYSLHAVDYRELVDSYKREAIHHISYEIYKRALYKYKCHADAVTRGERLTVAVKVVHPSEH